MMKIKFADNPELSCNNPTEQKLYKDGTHYGWLFMVSIYTNKSSSEIDTLLSNANIATITIETEAGETVSTITGYTKVTNVIIKYSDTNVVDIQITKTDAE